VVIENSGEVLVTCEFQRSDQLPFTEILGFYEVCLFQVSYVLFTPVFQMIAKVPTSLPQI